MVNESGKIIVCGDVHVYLNDKHDHHNMKVNDPKIIRRSTELKHMKKEVRSRDIHCQCCGEQDKKLQVHHILPLSRYPELSCDSSNMICLCKECHDRYHKEYKGNEGAVSFSEFMRRYGKRGRA